MIGSEIDSNACEAAGTAIVALAARVDPQRRADAIAGLKGMISRFSNSTSAPKHVTEIALQFDLSAINQHCGDVMTALLEWNALRGEYFNIDDLNRVCQFESPVMAFNDTRTVATLLQHPGCTGKLREHLVKRFEELVYHDGKHVFLTLPESGSRNSAMADDELGWGTPNRSPIEPSLRRFHTVHDAAAWIQRNWLDFDLEATHPVTWRGER